MPPSVYSRLVSLEAGKVLVWNRDPTWCVVESFEPAFQRPDGGFCAHLFVHRYSPLCAATLWLARGAPESPDEASGFRSVSKSFVCDAILADFFGIEFDSWHLLERPHLSDSINFDMWVWIAASICLIPPLCTMPWPTPPRPTG